MDLKSQKTKLTNDELIDECTTELQRLCLGSGGYASPPDLSGRDWTMRIPIQENDSDVLFTELIDRFKNLIRELSIRNVYNTRELEVQHLEKLLYDMYYATCYSKQYKHFNHDNDSHYKSVQSELIKRGLIDRTDCFGA